MKRISVLLAALGLVLATTASTAADEGHIRVKLLPVNGSGVTGMVDLQQLPDNGGTHIALVAHGLEPGSKHVSLYYDNHVCHVEPYSRDDVIGFYTADARGIGHTQSDVDDNLDAINSVSVRAADFTLLACAVVHRP